MPANWGFVLAAYGLAAVVIFLYWRRLVKKEHEIERLKTETATRVADRSREPSRTAHPRSEPGSRHSLQQSEPASRPPLQQ